MNWLFTLVFSGLAFSPDVPVIDTTKALISNDPISISREFQSETEAFEQTYPFSASGRVAISNVNGSITVEAWDRNEIKLAYVKTADTKERLADVDVKIDARQDSFSVETDYSRSQSSNKGDREYWRNGGKLSVEFKLMVPRTAVLNEVETVNGSVAVSNFTNRTKISAVNGNVNATNLRGSAECETVNGQVTAEFDSLDSAGIISLSTVNGEVRLVIPSDAGATVRAESLNGNITTDFGLAVRKGKYVGRDVHGRLGSGGTNIKLESVNGALSIGRRNDGRTPSPVTNLLTQKGTDEDEFGHFPAIKINKEAAKAIKASRAEVHRELKAIAPELRRMKAEAAVHAAAAVDMKAVRAEVAQAMSVRRAALAPLADIDFAGGVPHITKRTNSFVVKGVPRIDVSARGCSVTVRGWDKSEVAYQVTQFSDQRNAEPISVNEGITDNGITLKFVNAAHSTRNGNFMDDARRMRVVINVPKRSNLKIVSNGEIRLEGITGEVDLSGDDEAINVVDSDGQLRISNVDGLVRVVGFRGDLAAQTSDGEFFLDGDFTSITGKSVDGKFLLTVPEDLNADVKTSDDQFVVDNVSNNRQISKGHWRFGAGGRNFVFVSQGGSLKIQNRNLLQFSK